MQPAEDSTIPKSFWKVHFRLLEQGLLLETDPTLPSLTKEIVKMPIRGSWWGHPKGQEIYAVSRALSKHEEVLVTKLVNGKITFVHRRLWPWIFWIATSGDSWQTKGLSEDSKKLLTQVKRKGQVLSTGKAVTELEKRLLAHAVSVHTKTGAHAKMVESWQHWQESVGFRPRMMQRQTAMARLKKIADTWQEKTGARVRLPWT